MPISANCSGTLWIEALADQVGAAPFTIDRFQLDTTFNEAFLSDRVWMRPADRRTAVPRNEQLAAEWQQRVQTL